MENSLFCGEYNKREIAKFTIWNALQNLVMPFSCKKIINSVLAI